MYAKFLEKIKLEYSNVNPSPENIISNYPNASDFDKCVILLRTYKLTYSQISSKLGSPSKKTIRECLLKHAPNLIEEDCRRGGINEKKMD